MASPNKEMWWFCSSESEQSKAQYSIADKLKGVTTELGNFYELLSVDRTDKHGVLFKFRINPNGLPFYQKPSDPLIAEILAANAMDKLKEVK